MFDVFLAYQARQRPRALAVVTPARRATYAQFDADVSRFAAGVLDLGLDVAPGQSVSLRFSDTYLQYVSLVALARIGVASAPGFDSRAEFRLTDLPEAADPGPPSQGRTVRLSRDGLAQIMAAPARDLPRPSIDPDGLGRVMLSSGTTRVPRRVGLSWRRLDAAIHGAVAAYAYGRLGVWIPVLGIDAMMGLTQAITAWSVGAAVANGYPVDELAGPMERYGSGIICMTPVQLRHLLARLPEGFTPQPGWMITTGGSALPLSVAREARLRLTPDIRVIYGATEAGLAATGHAAGLETAPDMIGHVPPGAEVQVVDDDDRPVSPGGSGELRIRGERTTLGYLDDPEGSAERFRDGWFYTRDIGRYLPDGRLVLEGRVDDRMNLGGIKFMPRLLEEAAFDCPGVFDCAAFAVPDAQGLDQCWLAVVAAPDFERDSLARHLTGYGGLPANRFAWIDEIPRNAMGKVERAKLRDALMAALGDAR